MDVQFAGEKSNVHFILVEPGLPEYIGTCTRAIMPLTDQQKSIVDSLDGRDEALYPFLDYLLQDLWEIGSSPKVIIELIKNHHFNQVRIKKVLDLGCGKGIVSIQLAKEFGFETHGIDAFPPFIKEATKWAKKYGVTSLCTFEVNDIRTRFSELNGYDMAILGSIGPVLGDTEETLNRVKKCIRPNGIIILDDGYIPDGSPHTLEGVKTRTEVMDKILKCSVKILDEYIHEPSDIEKSNKDIYKKIENRAAELIEKHPDKAYLFREYLKAQAEENDVLENHMCCVTWVLQKEST